MLSVYTRHCPSCRRTDVHYRRCHCPKWILGVLDTHRSLRVTPRTRSWAEAEGKARKMEHDQCDQAVTVEIAVRAFLREQEARQLSRPSLNESRGFLE